jgi:glycosyltransferase involved in cell wall biosynthesis
MSAPLVSVLIPCFNAARHVGETLDSVLAQTWPNVEIVVVDDGSTDRSAEVVEAYASRGVTLIRQPNAGAGAARNRAFAAARGELIQFLDADDLIDPDKIAIQAGRLARHTGAVASVSWGRFWTDPAQTRFEPETNWCDLDPVEWLTRSRMDGLGMLFPALWLTPRSVCEAAGAWDESLSLGDDGEYFTRVVLAADRVLFCEDARCRYRSGLPGSLSASTAWDSAFRVNALCEQAVRARDDGERVRRGFALSWQHLAHACYPYDPALAERALARGQALHPISVPPGGGAAFRTLSRLIGWRAARRLQVASGRR